MKHYLVILICFLLGACETSKGFNRGEMRQNLNGNVVTTDAEIAKVLDLKPQLPKKFRLAVYFKEGYNGYYPYRSNNWTANDKQKLEPIKTELKKSGIISEAVLINHSLVNKGNLKSIRLAVARAGADAVLVIQGTGSIDKYNNPLGATYCLLVTPFFVPGTVADCLFIVRASMWDVRNEYLYLSTEVEGTASETNPAFFIEENRVTKEARSNAMENLAKEFLFHVKELNER